MEKEKMLLKGVGCSSGTATGRVRLVRPDQGAVQFEDGDVLVTKMTDPTMVIMMAKAAAIVTDTGGLTSHAAIVSREMGIPCVVATQTATTTLTDGQLVTVNGDTGEVFSTKEQA